MADSGAEVVGGVCGMGMIRMFSSSVLFGVLLLLLFVSASVADDSSATMLEVLLPPVSVLVG